MFNQGTACAGVAVTALWAMVVPMAAAEPSAAAPRERAMTRAAVVMDFMIVPLVCAFVNHEMGTPRLKPCAIGHTTATIGR